MEMHNRLLALLYILIGAAVVLVTIGPFAPTLVFGMLGLWLLNRGLGMLGRFDLFRAMRNWFDSHSRYYR